MEDLFFNVKNTKIKIGGLDREYHFLQISDTHVCAVDGLSGGEEVLKAKDMETRWDSVKADFAHHFGDRFGDEQKITTVAAFKKLFAFAKEENPDALIISGDCMDFIHGAAERLLASELEGFGNKVIGVDGNHESVSGRGVWEGFAEHNFGGFRIIALDDSKKTISDGTLEKLEAALRDDTPAIIVMHIPFATDMNREDMKKFSEYFVIDEQSCDANAKEMIRLFKENDCVKAVLCGHVHGWHESVFAEGKTQFCCSASMIGNVRKIIVE